MRPPILGSNWLKYRLNKGRSIAFDGLENSSTATQPPGFKTLASSARPLSTLDRFRNPKAIVATSNVPSRKGRSNASPSIKRMRPEVLPAAISNIGRQKSVPTTPAPVVSNNVSDKSPVPHATSRTRALLDESLSRTRVATIRRQRLSTLPDSKWFKRSYRLAIDANMSRTRPACSFAALPFSSGTVKPNLMEVWLQVGCEQFVITWDCRLSRVSSLVSLAVFAMAPPAWRSRRVLRTENVLAALLLEPPIHQPRQMPCSC